MYGEILKVLSSSGLLIITNEKPYESKLRFIEENPAYTIPKHVKIGDKIWFEEDDGKLSLLKKRLYDHCQYCHRTLSILDMFAKVVSSFIN